MKINPNRRDILRLLMVMTGGGIGMGAGLYTWRYEPFWLDIVHRKLAIKNLPEQLEGASLAQLSDLHIGPSVDDSYLIQTFERINTCTPDIVVYTGDFTSYHSRVFSHADKMFAHLPLGKRATFGILGNHDYGPGWSRPEVAVRIASLAGKAGVHILRNEKAEIDGLQIAGCDDLWSRHCNLKQTLSTLDPQRASLVLIHNPDTADLAGWRDYSGWILAGHTHGGQCKPPFLPPPLLPVRNRRYTSGDITLSGQRRMYINRGVGYLISVRFNSRPEVTLFELTRA